jgi:hypothetical protein
MVVEKRKIKTTFVVNNCFYSEKFGSVKREIHIRILTLYRSLRGRSQSSDGLWSQSISSFGTGRDVEYRTASSWYLFVVELLVSSSAREARGVDFLGRC